MAEITEVLSAAATASEGTPARFWLAFTIGVLVGVSELLSKYSWTIKIIAKSSGGWCYVLINGCVAAFAYYAALDWKLLELGPEKATWRVIAVSFLAMAALRSSFINLKIGDQELAAGLAQFLKVFSSRAERSLDQAVALGNYHITLELVDGLSYQPTRDFIIGIASGILRSISSEEEAAMRADVANIEAAQIDDETRVLLFSIRLSEYIGTKLFTTLARDAKKRLVVENKREFDEKSEKLSRLEKVRTSLLGEK